MNLLESLGQTMLVVLVVWAIFRIALLNFTIARLLGAPWGRSTSAHLWALDQGLADAWWVIGPFTATLAGGLRRLVDLIAWTAGRHQEDHCKVAYLREVA